MKKKIVIFCIAGLFFLTTISSVTALTINNNNTGNSNYDQVDQTQTEFTHEVGLLDGIYWAQSFKPSLSKLTKVDVLINRNSPDISSTVILRICESLDPYIPRAVCQKNNLKIQVHPNNEWHEFDFDDIYVTPGETYYIVLYGLDNPPRYYQWFYSINNPYPHGTVWHNAYPPINEGWFEFNTGSDFCFRTYGDNSDQPPVADIEGPSVVGLGKESDYYAIATDPEGNPVCFQIDWGDELSGWLEHYASGSSNHFSHAWFVEDTYSIKVRAKDYYTGNIGSWSDPIQVTVQKSRSVNTPLYNFLQRYPLLFQLIQRLL